MRRTEAWFTHDSSTRRLWATSRAAVDADKGGKSGKMPKRRWGSKPIPRESHNAQGHNGDREDNRKKTKTAKRKRNWEEEARVGSQKTKEKSKDVEVNPSADCSNTEWHKVEGSQHTKKLPWYRAILFSEIQSCLFTAFQSIPPQISPRFTTRSV